MSKLCQPWDTQSNIASKFRIEEAELVVVNLSEKVASGYGNAKSLIVLGVYLSESLLLTYHTTECHKRLALYLSENSAPNRQFKRRHTVVAWYLTERLAQSCHTSRCLDTEDHNNDIHFIRTLLTYLHTSVWRRVFVEKLTSLKLVKKFAALYGIRGFITTFTSAQHLPLSWASSIQSIPAHPSSRRSILILSSHLRLGLASDLFPSVFPTNTFRTPLPSAICATCHAHLILHDFFIRKILGEELKSLNSS